MATSSITKQWAINSKEDADRLMEIIEDGEKANERLYTQKACELVADYEAENPEMCSGYGNIRILTAFHDEEHTDMYHVILMTDHVYDVQFTDKNIVIEIFCYGDFCRYDKEGDRV